MYKETRFLENVQLGVYTDGVGQFNMPQVDNIEFTSVDKWIGFNYMKRDNDRENHGLHFFLDDYQFERVWRDVDRYIPILYQYKYVIAPDFSTACNFPKPLNIYNTYRRNWLSRYWQDNYINVIPNVGWIDEDSYNWCFDGYSKYGTIALSSQSCLTKKNDREWWIKGYTEMVKRLEPECIIFYGKAPEEIDNILPSRVVFIDTTSDMRWNNKRREENNGQSKL